MYINSTGTTNPDGTIVGFETEGTAIYDAMCFVRNEVGCGWFEGTCMDRATPTILVVRPTGLHRVCGNGIWTGLHAPCSWGARQALHAGAFQGLPTPAPRAVHGFKAGD